MNQGTRYSLDAEEKLVIVNLVSISHYVHTVHTSMYNAQTVSLGTTYCNTYISIFGIKVTHNEGKYVRISVKKCILNAMTGAGGGKGERCSCMRCNR
jgi:hypothetical protein